MTALSTFRHNPSFFMPILAEFQSTSLLAYGIHLIYFVKYIDRMR
jgi:hypothetical protein